MSRVAPLAMAVAVVSFNTRELLEPCLHSVLAAGPSEAVVVDNGSTDGSIELVRSRFPDMRLIVNERNVGYGAAANQAIATCRAPAVLLLNGDTVIAADGLDALGRYLAEHPRVAVVGPRLVNDDGSLQPSTFSFPSPADALMGDTGLHRLVRRVPRLRERFLRTWSHDSARPVSWVRGAALAIRRSAFDEVGRFDEDFFMYWEEVDLCRRLAAAGLQTHYTPITTVKHVRAAATGKVANPMRREWLIGQRRYLQRHESRASAALQLGLLRTFATARVARDAVRVRLVRDKNKRARLRASIAGWRALLAEPRLWKP
jgi:GT2 family glycosyltransferase